MMHNHNHETHAHGHTHSHGVTASAAKLLPSLALTVLFVIVETVAGLRAHSLALLSDAGHNLSDAAALGFSWFAVWIAKRPPSPRRTYGYHRVSILVAFANALFLVALAFLIGFEAIHRLVETPSAHGGVMMVVALVGIVLNLLISYWLRAGNADLNIRSAYLHMIGDALSAAGVVVAGGIIRFTGWTAADPIVSFLIAALILWSSWGILLEATNVLLEGAPFNVDVAEVEAAIRSTAGVLDVHDLHVWTLSSGRLACSCHVTVAEQPVSEGQQILRAVVDVLHRFGVNHTTVQMEVDGCEPNHVFCSMPHSSEVHK